MSRWWAAIGAHRGRASRYGLFWLLMCALAVCAWFAPGLTESSRGAIRSATALLAAVGAGLTAVPMGLSGALAGGLAVTLHTLFQAGCQTVHQSMFPLTVARDRGWMYSPRWIDALVEALVIVVITFSLGAVVGYLAGLFQSRRGKA